MHSCTQEIGSSTSEQCMTNRQVLVQVIEYDYYLVDLATLVHLIQ
jgi:hypothetical protein